MDEKVNGCMLIDRVTNATLNMQSFEIPDYKGKQPEPTKAKSLEPDT